MAYDSRAKEICDRSLKLFRDMRPWLTWCQEIADNFYPMRADFTRKLTLGSEFAGVTMDGSTVNYRETLGNSISSMLRQGEWYEMGTGNETRDAQQDAAMALAYATRQLRGLVKDRRAKFDAATKEADHDWVAFGECPMSVEANMVDRHLMFRTWHPRDVAMMANAFGDIDTVHRQSPMTARVVAENINSGRWNGTLPTSIEQARRLDPTREVPLRHVLMPMDELYGDDKEKRRKLGNAKYVSLYIAHEADTILHEAPSRVFNYVIPRFRTLGSMLNGFSPMAINSLPDARMLQQMALSIIEQAQKSVDPPIVLASEFLGRQFNLYAGGATHVELADGRGLRDMLSTIDTGQGLPIGLELKEDIRKLLMDAWLLNKLFMPDLREMTAYEASQRVEEFRRAALPFFTPIQSNYHEPLLGTAWEMGVLTNMIDTSMFPPSLHGEDIVFGFKSPLEEAEGQAKVAAFQQSMAIVAAGAQVDPTVGKLFDVHTATIDAVRGSGAKPEWILPPDKLAAAKDQADQDKQLHDLATKLSTGSAIAQQLSGGVMAARQAGLIKGPAGAVPDATTQAAPLQQAA